MKQNRFPAGPLLVVCLVFSLAACDVEAPYETPTGVTLEVYPKLVWLSWSLVDGADGYNIRANGELVNSSPIATTYYPILDMVPIPAKGTRFTVTAVYGGSEGPQSTPLVVGEIAELPPALSNGADKSQDIESDTGSTRPGAMFNTTLSPQGVDYYVIPIDKTKAYYFWWNDAGDGDATKTLDVSVEASWYKSGTAAGSGTDGFGIAGITIPVNPPNYIGYVVLEVKPAVAGKTGTYGIAYSYQ
jgi:hypothetical protein